MAMTREMFREFLDPVIWGIYEQTFNKGDDIIPLLFDVNNTELAQEKVTGIGGLGLMQPWDGTVHYDSPEALWTKYYIPQKYSIGIQIERELWDDAQHTEIKDRVQRATLSVFRTRQLHATSIFNNAFNPNFPGPDGAPLCGDHPLSPTNSTTQSNAGNLPFTIDNIEETRVRMREFTDDRGNRLLLNPDTLIVPPRLEMQAQEFLQSTGRADTADNADNVRKGAYKIVTLDFLDDSNTWFMVDSGEMKRLLKWFERRKPVPERNEDFDTEFLKWKYVCRYAYGFHGWWFCYGNKA